MLRRFVPLLLMATLGSAAGYAETWRMRNRDMHNTGRADFVVPAARLNSTFFDVIRWQKQSPCCPGDFSGTSMGFYDDVGPGAADIVVSGYHWPKGYQGMDRHTGELFWFGNPCGGETTGRESPAFSADGTTVYVIAEYCDHPVMAFPTTIGPSAWRGLADPSDPNKGYLGYGSPLVAPDGRVFSWGWNTRPAGVTDDGTSLSITWMGDVSPGMCYGGSAIYQYGPTDLRIVSNGRGAVAKSYNGGTGATLWSKSIKWTDCPPTIDPSNGKIYIPAGSDSIWVIGLSKDGANLWGSNPWVQVYSYTGSNTSHVARSAGCLSHDGQTFYFQTTTSTTPGQGRLWAIRTSNGTVKWSYGTQAATNQESWDSSPIVTPNGVLIVGNDNGGSYFALQDNGTSATLLDTFTVGVGGTASATATLSNDGLLYLPLHTPWITTNGNTDIPSLAVENVYTAFDLNDGAQMYLPIPEGSLAAPTGLAVTPFYSTAYMHWNALSDPSVRGYVVYRRTAAGGYTVPVKRVLRTGYTDYNLTPGQTYYYKVMAIDGSGTPVSHLSVETGATLATDPSPYSTHHNFELLMVIYKGGYTKAEVAQMKNGLKVALEFYWRTSRCRLNLDVTWLEIDGYPPGNDWGDPVQSDLRNNHAVQDSQFDLAYLAGNNLAGCYGGYIVFRNTPASLGTVCGTPYPAKDPNTNYTITWCFAHEVHHALEVMHNLCPGTPEVLFDHYPWCYPDPLGPTGWHMDWNTQYDGLALTNRQYGDQWSLFPPPYDGYIECVDADGDNFPDNDARVWMDEARFGSSPLTPDTDGDGLDDLAEFSAYNFRGTSPTNPDTDGDGLLDGADPQPLYRIQEYLPHFTTPPVIDGTIEASWPALTTGYYFTQNSTDFTLKTYCGWDANAIYLAFASSRKLRFMVSIDGSGKDGRYESPVRYVTGTTDTYNVDTKPQQIGDSWADLVYLYFAHGEAGVHVTNGPTIAGSAVASTQVGSMYYTEAMIPRQLPAGAPYTWYPPDAPVVDGLTLTPGHVIGLNVTMSNYSGSDYGEFSGTWTSLFETFALVDFVLQLPGDVNCDGHVDFDDINPFVTALVSRAGYESLYPGCAWLNADCNGDGRVDFDDINPFVACLVNGGCQ